MDDSFRVLAYSGYQGEQEPREIVMEGRRVAVREIEDRWVEPRARYFKVRAENGVAYLLRFDLGERCWSLAGPR